MTLVPFQGTVPFPPIIPVDFLQITDILKIDAANEKIAFCFQAPKTGDVAKVGFRTGTVLTGATIDVRLETMDSTNGDPTGTLISANSNAAQVIQDTDDNTWFTPALTANASVTQGVEYNAVFVNPGTSFGDINIATIADGPWLQGSGGQGFPYSNLNTGSWTKQIRGILLALEYSDGSYEEVVGLPVSAIGNNIYNSSSNPNNRGLKFKTSFPFRAAGFWITGLDVDGDCDVKVVEGGSSFTTLYTIDTDIRQTNGIRFHVHKFYEFKTFAADTYYRLVLVPKGGGNIRLYHVDVDTVAIMDAMTGGQDFHYTEANNPTVEGDWTDTTTRRPTFGLLIDQFDDGAGGVGGGVKNHPGMNGGMNG
jgi:hypothetical protein